MRLPSFIACGTAVMLLLSIASSTLGEVTVDPIGFALGIEEDAEAEVELLLNNTGDSDVDFKIDVVLVEDEDGRRGGPRRDDLGDLIDEFDRPLDGRNGYLGGIAWDWENEWMWFTELETANPARVAAVDPANDYEVVEQFNAPGQMMDAAWCEGVLYVVNWSNNWLFRFDAEGENLGNLNFQFRPTACAASQERNWLFVMDDAGNKDILIFDIVLLRNEEGDGISAVAGNEIPPHALVVGLVVAIVGTVCPEAYDTYHAAGISVCVVSVRLAPIAQRLLGGVLNSFESIGAFRVVKR